MLEWLRERAESDLEIKKQEIKENRDEGVAMEATRLEKQQKQQQQVLQQQQQFALMQQQMMDVSTTTTTNAGSAVFSTKKGIILMYIQS